MNAGSAPIIQNNATDSRRRKPPGIPLKCQNWEECLSTQVFLQVLNITNTEDIDMKLKLALLVTLAFLLGIVVCYYLHPGYNAANPLPETTSSAASVDTTDAKSTEITEHGKPSDNEAVTEDGPATEPPSNSAATNAPAAESSTTEVYTSAPPTTGTSATTPPTTETSATTPPTTGTAATTPPTTETPATEPPATEDSTTEDTTTEDTTTAPPVTEPPSTTPTGGGTELPPDEF